MRASEFIVIFGDQKVLPNIAVSNLSIAEAATNTTAVGTASIHGVTTGTPTWSITDASGTFQMDPLNLNSATCAIQVLSNTALATNASFPVTISVSGTTPAVPNLATTIWVVASQAVLDLIAASDTGSSTTDNITKINTPTFDVTATLYTNDVIKLYDNNVLAFTHILNSTEAAARSFNDTTVFSDGNHPFTLTVSRGGFENTPSASLTVTIDTVAPVLSSPSGTKTGSSTANVAVTTNDAGTSCGTMAWFVDTTSSAPVDSSAFATRLAAVGAGAKASAATISSTSFTGSATGLSSATTYYPYFMQTDTAGNFSNIAAAASFTTDAAAAYTPQGVVFSSTAYATLASALTGVANGKSGLLSVWIKNTNASGTLRFIFESAAAGPNFHFRAIIHNSLNQFVISGTDTAGTLQLNFRSNTIFTSMSSWAHVLASWNVATGRVQLYTNDVSDVTSLTANNVTLDYTQPNTSIGAEFATGGVNGVNPYGSNISDLQIWFNKDIDLATTANRRLFIDGSGNAVDPATAATSIGTQNVLCSGASATWVTNDGSGGGFTLATGTVTNAATNPP